MEGGQLNALGRAVKLLVLALAGLKVGLLVDDLAGSSRSGHRRWDGKAVPRPASGREGGESGCAASGHDIEAEPGAEGGR